MYHTRQERVARARRHLVGSVEVVRLGELLDEGAAAPGGGAGRARGRGRRRGPRARRQAGVRAAAPPPLARPPRGVGAVQLERPRAREQARVGRGRALVAPHLAGRAARERERELGRDRRRPRGLARARAGRVILYFTEGIVGVVHCRCDIKAAACNKIETFRLTVASYLAHAVLLVFLELATLVSYIDFHVSVITGAEVFYTYVRHVAR